MELQIKGHGNANSKILLIGDYPSKIEVERGYALTGFNEDMLDEMLRKAGSSLKSTFRTCYIKKQIDGFGYNKARDTAIIEQLAPNLPEFKEILTNEIVSISPNVIVPLGELALNYISNEVRIDKFRGSVLSLSPEIGTTIREELYQKIKVIPTWSMRELIRNQDKKPIAQLDFGKIAELSKTEAPYKNKYNVWVCKNCNDFNAFLKRNLPCKFGTFDIETHHGFITCISFCFNGIEAVSVPLMEDSIPILDRVFLFQRIVRLLRQSDIQWVNQNILYDLTVEERYGLYVKNIVGDTMLAQHTLYVEMLKGLDFLTSIYTDIPYYKDEGKEYDPKLGHSKDQLYLYNAKDSLATWLVWEQQLIEFDENKLQKAFFFDLNQLQGWNDSSNSGILNLQGDKIYVPQGVMPLFHIYRKINKRGVRIDEEKRTKLRVKYNQVLEEYINEISSTVGHPVNARSPKQVQELVYSELGCPKIYKLNRETGKKTLDTGREALEEICFNKLDERNIDDAGKITLLKKVIYTRKAHKIIKYLDLPLHPDGRMRTIFKLSGTKSGRTAGSSTIDKLFVIDEDGKIQQVPDSKKQGLGTSFHTIPKHGFIDDETEDGQDPVELGKDIMEIFVPSPDFVFFDGDKSQAEARIVAVLAEDYEILEAFNRPKSYIHRLTSSWIYKCSPDDIQKHTIEYEMGKRSRHGVNYGMEPYRFSRMCHIALTESTTILNRVHQNQPKIRGVFHAKIRDEVKRVRKLVNPYGRQRDIFTPPTEKNLKDFISWIPQGTCSDGTKFAMLRIEAACEDQCVNGKILMEVHDNLVCEVHKDSVDRFAKIYKSEMEKPVSFRDHGTFIRDFELVIPVEMGFSAINLGAMKDYII